MLFLKLNIINENDELIYSCCGIKNCNNIGVIHSELLSNYKNIFKNTVLDIWKYRVCDELCWH